ncbi:FecR family protein [Thermophagus sp. OGC60D27]|uniref:FecR family protein n=1 Tax=Thermophagus sp. OGC60D27 TaxID=3458415 RepID=UPI004037C2D3
MNKQKLEKFANHSLTNKKEIEEIMNWIEASETNREEFNHLKNRQAYKYFLNFDKIQNNQRSTIPLYKKFRIYEITKYAAILILVFLIGGVLFQPIKNTLLGYGVKLNKIVVPYGESAELILADQTHVWLNSGSTLKYPSDFGSGARKVELSGEAFFDVSTRKGSPFIVNTSELRVKVLGTSFNVEALPNAKTIDITLVKGSICIENNEGKRITKLKPHERAVFNKKSKKIKISSSVDTKLYTSWKDGVIYFEDESLEMIASKIEAWFNIIIVFDDPSLKNIKYTGAILKNKPIDQLLEILNYTANIDTNMEIKHLEPNVVHIKKRSQ